MTEGRDEGAAGRPLASRSVWAFIGQGLSSSSNVVLSLFVLSTASRAQFAAFSVCVLSYQLVLQLSRSFLSLPLLILYSGNRPSAESFRPARAVVGLVVATGVAAAVPLAFAGVIIGDGGGQFYVLAALMPVLLYQDAVRHVAFARADPKAAALSDALWLALQLSSSAFALALGYQSSEVFVGAWGASGAASGCLIGARLGATPQFVGMGAWLRRHWALCKALLGEFVLISGSTYLVYYALGVLAGTSQLGRIRAAQTFMGPVTVALLGGAALGVPESVRLRHEPGGLRRFSRRLSLTLAAGSLLVGAMAFWLLPVIGPSLFPNTWASARPVLPALTLFAVALAANTGAVSALRALGQMRWIVRTRAMTGGLALAASLPASALHGAYGAVSSLAAAEVLFSVLAIRRLHRRLVIGADTAPLPAAPPDGDAERWRPEL